MRKLFPGIVFVFLTVGSALGQPKATDSVPGQLLVQSRLGANPSVIARTLAAHGAVVQKEIPQIHVHVLRVPETAIDRVQQALAASGLFTFVERDHIAHVVATPNDPNFVSEWHLTKIQAPNAWSITIGSPAVTIAFADTGIDPTHEDLASKLVPGWSFVNGTADTTDVYGHGTATAGSAGAATNNGIGVASAGWLNTIMPLQVTDPSGSAPYSYMASAITYAADHKVRIINMSLAGSIGSSTLQSAVSYAWNKGTVLFASAGNYATSTPYYPAACTNAVAVSATDANDNLSSYSNYGNWIDLSAPGDSILTTNNGGGYSYWSGTSFASPIAASVAALVLSVKPTLSASALVSLLEQNADDLGAPGFDQYFGWGRVNAYKAVLAAASGAVDPTPPVASLSSPASGATVSGTISVQGTASDNVGVTKIELYVDNQLVSSAASSPFSFSWSTTGVTNGSHTLTVKAYDAASNVGQASVTVNVSNVIVVDITPPVDVIMSPVNGVTINAKNVKINVSATDNVGVTQVSIYIDGILQSTLSAAPYSYSLSTRRLTSGSHIITAKAWDAAGNVGLAAPISVIK